MPAPSDPQVPQPAPGATLSDLGEFGVLDHVVTRQAMSEAVLLGPGDDAAVVAAGSGRILFATDVLVDGRHFRRDWAEAGDIGCRAAAQSLSDLNAMGGRATAVTVGVAAPPDLEARWLLALADGLAEECARVGASVVGGDLTASSVLTVAVSAIGHADGREVLRSGARPGDVVAVRGRLGFAAAGLAVLSRGFRSPRAVVEAYRRPEVPYGEGAVAAAAGATSLIDVSDGLLADLGHVAAASAVGIDVRRDAFEVADPVAAVGAALGLDPLDLVLTGGDDHALVATFPAGAALPEGWREVGVVVDGAAEAGVVHVDGSPWPSVPGFRHFSP